MSDGNDPLAGLTDEQMARLTTVVSESIDYQQRLRLKSCATPFIERTEDARLDLLRIGLDVLRRAGHPDFPEPTPTDPHAAKAAEMLGFNWVAGGEPFISFLGVCLMSRNSNRADAERQWREKADRLAAALREADAAGYARGKADERNACLGIARTAIGRDTAASIASAIRDRG